MKKLLVLLASSAFSTLAALPIGNTAALDSQVGFTGNYVFNRRLMLKKSMSEVPKTEIYSNSATFSYGSNRRFQFDGTVGATNLKLNTHFSSLSPNEVGNEDIFLETNTALSYSLAFRSKIGNHRLISPAVEVEYFRTNPKLNMVTDPTFNVVLHPNASLAYRELQLGFALSFPLHVSDFATFIPYAGLKLSRVNATFSKTSISILETHIPLTNLNLSQDRSLGYAIGATLFNAHTWNLTAEGRFADETAFSLTTNLVY